MELIIVTGFSGAGKSQAMHCLEDLGYYCIDNMPPALIRNFIDLTVKERTGIRKVAFVIDIRGGEFFDDLLKGLDDLKKAGVSYKILFLEASDEVLLRRYKETRRVHPMSMTGSIQEGIAAEKERLAAIRREANYILDTSNMKAAQLSEEIRNLMASPEASRFTLTILSFGYKKGIPLDADMVFDLRFIPNPFYLASLKQLTGNSKKVKDYVMRQPETQPFIDQIHRLINDLIPSYIREGKPQLVLAFGCTGGQHRSVALANIFTELFRADGWRVIPIHRDL
jgi:UPF0042 nucleotide-binding protein